MRLRQALRLFESGATVDATALCTLSEADVRASRQFAASAMETPASEAAFDTELDFDPERGADRTDY